MDCRLTSLVVQAQGSVRCSTCYLLADPWCLLAGPVQQRLGAVTLPNVSCTPSIVKFGLTPTTLTQTATGSATAYTQLYVPQFGKTLHPQSQWTSRRHHRHGLLTSACSTSASFVDATGLLISKIMFMQLLRST